MPVLPLAAASSAAEHRTAASRASIFAVASVLTLLVVPAASAAWVYVDGIECLDDLPPPCVPTVEGSPGARLGDPTEEVPENEVIDLLTGIVYEYDGSDVKQVGAGLPGAGYVRATTYLPGQSSGEVVHDTSCWATSATTRESCGPCTAILLCVTWRAAILGSHTLTLRYAWTYEADHCGTILQHVVVHVGRGGPVTIAGSTVEVDAPAYCWPGQSAYGTVTVSLLVDNTEVPWSVPSSATWSTYSCGSDCDDILISTGFTCVALDPGPEDPGLATAGPCLRTQSQPGIYSGGYGTYAGPCDRLTGDRAGTADVSCLGPASPWASSILRGCMRFGAMATAAVNAGEPRDDAIFACSGPQEAALEGTFVRCSTWAQDSAGAIIAGETPPILLCVPSIPVVPFDLLPQTPFGYEFLALCGTAILDLPCPMHQVTWCLTKEIVIDGRTCLQTYPQ